jgi:hypothetical protein
MMTVRHDGQGESDLAHMDHGEHAADHQADQDAEGDERGEKESGHCGPLHMSRAGGKA